MNIFNKLKKTRLVAIKNFDDDLYRLVKAYASLEGRTISSIFEEAIRTWIKRREKYEEVRMWVNLEEAYEANIKLFKEKLSSLRDKRGYVVICNNHLLGVFETYDEAIRSSRRECKIQALIIKLPFKEKETIELGLPW